MIAELGATTITCANALEIASKDAERVYRDLGHYRIRIERADDRWFVDYELKDRQMCGGGPHYVIDASSGEIISKRYEQ